MDVVRTERMNAKNDERLVRLIRERFHPLTRFCGPLHAGEVSLDGVSDSLYLGELSIWLWPHGSGHNGVLSDELVSNAVSPHFLVRALLVSSRNSMDMLVGVNPTLLSPGAICDGVFGRSVLAGAL